MQYKTPSLDDEIVCPKLPLPELDIKSQSTFATTPTSVQDAQTLNNQKVYDTYLARLNENSEFAETLTTKPNQKQSIECTDEKKNKQPLDEAERTRIRERYSEKAKERRLRMYEKAILLAEEREREEGKRYRLQRQLHFKITYETYFGQNVFVVGSSSPLGNWDISKATPLNWCPNHLWTGSVTVSVEDGVIEYKYILKDANTNKVVWEPGQNHKVDATKVSSTMTLDDVWSQSNNSAL